MSSDRPIAKQHAQHDARRRAQRTLSRTLMAVQQILDVKARLPEDTGEHVISALDLALGAELEQAVTDSHMVWDAAIELDSEEP